MGHGGVDPKRIRSGRTGGRSARSDARCPLQEHRREPDNRAERPIRMGRRGERPVVVKLLIAWILLSVPIAVLVGRIIRLGGRPIPRVSRPAPTLPGPRPRAGVG